MKNELILFENQEIKLEVNMKDETVWLSIDQMAKLFQRDKSVIFRHIKNAINEELNGEVVIAKFANTTKHGAIDDKQQTHMIDYYNLDVIVSVGYRVKSKNGIIFRKWANKVLKDHLLKGYSINQKQLDYLEKTVKLIDIASRIDEETTSKEIKDVIKVINSYSKALDLLDDYDHNNIRKTNGGICDKKITYDNCMKIIKQLSYNEKSKLFALEKNKGLESIINDIYQTFDNKELYKTIEEKAANFLYLIVKNHVFVDGNKRIAATLFIYFLQFYNLLYRDEKQVIDNNTLAALTLLIAESNPYEKSLIINLITNFLD